MLQNNPDAGGEGLGEGVEEMGWAAGQLLKPSDGYTGAQFVTTFAFVSV